MRIFFFLLMVGVQIGVQPFGTQLFGTPSPTETPRQVEIAQAQPTPLEVQILTSTPLPVDVATSTPSITPSAAVQSAVTLQAKQSAGEINVRSGADIDSEILGKIRYGEQYVVIGRYFRWYQIGYENAPNRVAWVYDELVDVTGDIALVPDLGLTPLATIDPLIAGATETAAVILQTPGGDLTITANAREIVGPVAVSGGSGTTQNSDGTPVNEIQRTPLPTFTYPAQVAAVATEAGGSLNTSAEVEGTSNGSGLTEVQEGAPPPDVQTVPPIVPIAILGGFGMLGLIVSSLRR